MTNKGKKYLQNLLEAEQAKTAKLLSNLENAAAKMNQVNKVNTAMEHDLLQICEPSIFTGFVRMIKLRRNLKKRRQIRQKQFHAQQLQSSIRSAQKRLDADSKPVQVPPPKTARS